MLLLKMVLVCIGAYIIVLIVDFIKNYKVNHYKIRCNVCGSEDTVVINNDRKEKVSYSIRMQNVEYIEHNPPSFFCNQCKKEYDCKEGTWIKKSSVLESKKSQIKEKNYEKYED